MNTVTSESGAAMRQAASSAITRPKSRREWSCSMQSTASRPPRPTIWRVVGMQSRQMRLVLGGINGMPRLMCMTRLNELPLEKTGDGRADESVSTAQRPRHGRELELQGQKEDQEIQARAPDAADGTWRMAQVDIDRVQEFRKCIECFLCQDVCHVLRDHRKEDEFVGPRYLVYVAALEMHPLDTENRLEELKKTQGIGYCNITKCCTKVCPESIKITDNAIIPLKERVVDEFYDPLGRLLKRLRPKQ